MLAPYSARYVFTAGTSGRHGCASTIHIATDLLTSQGFVGSVNESCGGNG